MIGLMYENRTITFLFPVIVLSQVCYSCDKSNYEAFCQKARLQELFSLVFTQHRRSSHPVAIAGAEKARSK